MTSTVPSVRVRRYWTPRRRGDKIEVKLTLQLLGDDLHVQQAQETAAEAKAQGGTGFRLKNSAMHR